MISYCNKAVLAEGGRNTNTNNFEGAYSLQDNTRQYLEQKGLDLNSQVQSPAVFNQQNDPKNS